MKQILLFFLVNLPLLVFSQFQETFESQELPEAAASSMILFMWFLLFIPEKQTYNR